MSGRGRGGVVTLAGIARSDSILTPEAQNGILPCFGLFFGVIIRDLWWFLPFFGGVFGCSFGFLNFSAEMSWNWGVFGVFWVL